MRTGASLGFGERSASSTELYGFYLFNANDGYDYIGKPELKPEQSLQADLNILYSWKNNRLQLTFFQSRVFQSIQPVLLGGFSTMTIGAKGVKSYNNIPYANIKGVEASAVVTLSSRIDLINTFKYLVGRDDEKKPLSNIYPLKNVSSIKWDAGPLSIRFEGEVAASQKQFNAAVGEDATAAYELIHCRLEWKTNWQGSNIDFQTGVENLLDRLYHEHLDWGNVPRPGRNFYFLVKLKR